ncbi:hypothetical protein BMS3Bbin16_01091 [archaeon BMS3Bbin16]|nr:hypothetical protein BMS3Bbin16_01091 [archaeon BMS3Bbin16]
MEYYIFCDFWDEHKEQLESDSTFVEGLYLYTDEGKRYANIEHIKKKDRFLFMGSGFVVRAKGEVVGKKIVSEPRPFYEIKFKIEQLKPPICLNDMKWRKFLANVSFNGKYGTFIKHENVTQLKAYFRTTVRKINKEIYDAIA